MSGWTWIVQYGVAIVVVLLLAAILGGSQLFHSAALGQSGITASHLVRFLGDAAALFLVWMAASRTAMELRDDGGWRTLVRRAVMPVATLIVLSIGYRVVLLLLQPVLNDATLAAYRWLFVVAITAAALWLALVAYENAGALASVGSDLARRLEQRRGLTRASVEPVAKPGRCDRCGAEIPSGASSCRACGTAVAA